ncbi:MAG: hypothetical protein KF851_04325 [Pirellulaceae bacterium]|nr:hypothetical protein [Pirellulaceae bacterium]
MSITVAVANEIMATAAQWANRLRIVVILDGVHGLVLRCIRHREGKAIDEVWRDGLLSQPRPKTSRLFQLFGYFAAEVT